MANPYCIDTNGLSPSPRRPPVPSWRQWAAIGLRKASDDLGVVIMGLVTRLEVWAERGRERRRLLALDERMLRDIGISSADAWREARKPVWRA